MRTKKLIFFLPFFRTFLIIVPLNLLPVVHICRRVASYYAADLSVPISARGRNAKRKGDRLIIIIIIIYILFI